MALNHTQKLRRAKDDGAKIVCSVGVHSGCEVAYRPRWTTDKKPWLLTYAESNGMQDKAYYRYTGLECRPVRSEENHGT